MARLFTGGFELNTNTTGVEFDTIVGSPTIATSTVRTGTYSGNIPSLTSTAQKYWQFDFLSVDGSTDAYSRFYLYIATLPNVNTTVGGYMSSANNVSSGVILNTDGTMSMKDNAGTTICTSSALNTNQWYRIEHRQFNTSTTLELKIDGVSIGSSTTASTAVYEAYVWGGNIAAETCTTINIFFDDLAINDATGGNQNGYPGSGKVLRLKPNAAGDVNTFSVQTGGTAGSANNFTRVNEVTPDDATSFNGSSTLNQEDLFNVDDSGIGASDTVNVVQLWGRVRNDVSDATAKITFELEKTGSGTKATDPAPYAPGTTTWRTNKTIARIARVTAYTDPDGGAWTQATLDSMQIGYKLTTAGTHAIDVTMVTVMVDYTPAAVVAASPPIIPIRIPNKFVGPMAMRYNFRQPYYPTPAISGANNYTQGLTGGLSFTGSFGPTKTFHGLTGGLSFTGSGPIRAITHGLSAALSFTGSLVKSTAHGLTAAALSFAGAITKKTSHLLSGGLSFTGSTPLRAISKLMSGGLSFTGSQTKFTTKGLTAAALSFTGAITKFTTKTAFTAALSFTGAMTKGAIHFLSFAGGLSFSGTITKQTGKALSGGLSFAGAMPRFISSHLTAALSFTGNLTKFTTKTAFAGVLSFTGAFAKGAAHFVNLTAALSFTGAITKQTSKNLSGGLSFAGSVTKFIAKKMSAALSFVGVIGAFKPGGPTITYPAVIILADGRIAKWIGGIVYLPL